MSESTAFFLIRRLEWLRTVQSEEGDGLQGQKSKEKKLRLELQKITTRTDLLERGVARVKEGESLDELRERGAQIEFELAELSSALGEKQELVDWILEASAIYQKLIALEIAAPLTLQEHDNKISKTDAVLEIVEAADPQEGIKASAIGDQLQSDGMSITRNHLYNILNRLFKDERVIRKDGRYFGIASAAADDEPSMNESRVN